jgi:hypothetical protein
VYGSLLVQAYTTQLREVWQQLQKHKDLPGSSAQQHVIGTLLMSVLLLLLLLLAWYGGRFLALPTCKFIFVACNHNSSACIDQCK